MSHSRFTVNPRSIFAWISRNSFLKKDTLSEVSLTPTRLERRPTLFVNTHSTFWPNWPNDRDELCVFVCTVCLSLFVCVCSCHVTYAFQSKSTDYFCRDVKELLTQNKRDIWNLSDCNGTPTHNHLVCKLTLNHLAQFIKWLSWIVSAYLYSALDCML